MDHDGDGITSLDEQNNLLNPTSSFNPDTDGDLLPDGWELDNGLNPNDSTDANLDSDNDGATNLVEYSFTSDPHNSDTDGDGTNDGTEINGSDGNADTPGGSNPNDSSDGGQPIPDEEKLTIKIGVGDQSGSHSEDYVMNIFRINPDTGTENRVYTLRSGGHGEYKEITQDIFRKNDTYTFQIDWQSSNLESSTDVNNPEGADYDYTFIVEPQGELTSLLIDQYDPETKTADPENPIGGDQSDVDSFQQTVEKKRIVLLPVKIVIPKLDSNGSEIEEEFVDANELKIAKMRGGEIISAGPNSVGGEYKINEDKDRFYVRIPGLPEGSEASIMLQTGHAQKPEYRDPQTEIELKYDPEKKLFTTKSMILVSDDLDDIHFQDLTGEASDMFVDEFKGDRSHKAFLGGIVRIASINFNGTEHELNLDLPVNAKKQVTVKIWRIKKQSQNLPYVAEALVNEHIKVLKERYVQIGLDVKIVGPLIKEIPNTINLDDGYQIQDLGNIGTVEEEDKFLEAVATENDADIEVFYVPNITDASLPDIDSAAGYSYVPSAFGDAKKKIHNNIIMSGLATRYVLAHELGHILLNDGAHEAA